MRRITPAISDPAAVDARREGMATCLASNFAPVWLAARL